MSPDPVLRFSAVDDLGRIRVELEAARRDGVPFEAAWRSALSPLPAVTSLRQDGRSSERDRELGPRGDGAGVAGSV
jgi:hypothetical protein